MNARHEEDSVDFRADAVIIHRYVHGFVCCLEPWGFLQGVMGMKEERLQIKEVIVVEGRDDISAVMRAVDAHVIAVHGYGVFRSRILEEIRQAQQRLGVIVLTDPDWAGEKIRRTIEHHVPGVKHAFIPRSAGRRETDGGIGVEYAEPAVILEALQQARCGVKEHAETTEQVSLEDLMEYRLIGYPEAEERRHRLGEILGVGRVNGKQFLRRIQHFGVSWDEFMKAIVQIEDL